MTATIPQFMLVKALVDGEQRFQKPLVRLVLWVAKGYGNRFAKEMCPTELVLSELFAVDVVIVRDADTHEWIAKNLP